MHPYDIETAFNNGQIESFELLFHLANYDDWYVPVEQTEDGQKHVAALIDPEDQQFMQLFMNADDLPEPKAKLPGYQLMAQIPEEVDYILLNVGDERGLRFKQSDFTDVQNVAQVVALDRQVQYLLKRPEQAVVHLAAIRPYVFIAVLFGEKNIALAPTEEGTNYLAFFTYAEAAYRYMDWYQEQGLEGEPKALQVPGEHLFQAVADAGVDGVILNPLGPAGQQLIPREICEQIGG